MAKHTRDTRAPASIRAGGRFEPVVVLLLKYKRLCLPNSSHLDNPPRLVQASFEPEPMLYCKVAGRAPAGAQVLWMPAQGLRDLGRQGGGALRAS